jgi:hypothetical protein
MTNPLRVSDASLALTEPNGLPCLTPTPSSNMSSYIMHEASQSLGFFYFYYFVNLPFL